MSEPKPLSEEMAQILKEGDTECRYASTGTSTRARNPRKDEGHDMMMGLLLAMVQARWTARQAEDALRDKKNLGGRYLQKIYNRSLGASEDAFVKTWRKAVARVKANPAMGDKTDCLVLLADIEATARASSWRGRTGMTDLRVLLTILSIARRASSVSLTISGRQISEAINVTLPTAQRALLRLVPEWLTLTHPSVGTTPATYHLVESKRHCTNESVLSLSNYLDEATDSIVQSPETHSHDAFVRGALSSSGDIVSSVLRPETSYTTKEISILAGGCHPSTAWRRLRDLEDAGIAEQPEKGRWRLAVKTEQKFTKHLDEIAEFKGTKGRGATRKALYDKYQAVHEARVRKWKEDQLAAIEKQKAREKEIAALPMLIDPDTGEILEDEQAPEQSPGTTTLDTPLKIATASLSPAKVALRDLTPLGESA